MCGEFASFEKLINGFDFPLNTFDFILTTFSLFYLILVLDFCLLFLRNPCPPAVHLGPAPTEEVVSPPPWLEPDGCSGAQTRGPETFQADPWVFLVSEGREGGRQMSSPWCKTRPCCLSMAPGTSCPGSSAYSFAELALPGFSLSLHPAHLEQRHRLVCLISFKIGLPNSIYTNTCM